MNGDDWFGISPWPPRASAATAAERRPPALVSPVKREGATRQRGHQGYTGHHAASRAPAGNNVWEVSPNNQSKCRKCGNKIAKGDMRVGKYGFTGYLERQGTLYYHENCVSENFKSRLQLKYPRVDQQDRKRLLSARRALREELRQMRLKFAQRLDHPAYCVFDNKTLDDIVVKVPSNKQELIACFGMKGKRYRNYGSCILAIVRRFQNKGRQEFHATEMDDEIVQVSQTLSAEQIVNMKFEHAESNGYMIEI